MPNLVNPQAPLPGVLSHLGKMTAMRDTLLLEQSLLKTLAPVLGVLDCTMFRANEAGDVVRGLHYHRVRKFDDSGAEQFLDKIEETNRAISLDLDVQDLLASVRLSGEPKTQNRTSGVSVAFPIVVGKTVCGYFLFYRDTATSPGEDAIVRGVLEVFSNYFNLLDASQRDHLTGLLNRQAMESMFTRMWSELPDETLVVVPPVERRAADTQGYWVAVIDIDFFKRVNDTFGHVIGDEILLLVSQMLAAGLRDSDQVYRFGGEEFIAVISAPDAPTANLVVNRLRTAIESHVFPQVGKVTVSIGVSRAHHHLLPQQVLNNSDQALYYSKEHGRNQVSDFDQLSALGAFQPAVYGESELF